MEVRPLYIIIVDISGYTRFIKLHKVALLHAEVIVGELMESVLDRAEVPVIPHEILGDAVTFYALDDGSTDMADRIYSQVLDYFEAFRQKEASLISECGLCVCEACSQVGKLKLKGVLHHRKAAFTKVKDIKKISGEDVILSHRLLKNSIPGNEYIAMTDDFAAKCNTLDRSNLEARSEQYDHIGRVDLLVNQFGDAPEQEPVEHSFWTKFRRILSTEKYMIQRFLGKKSPVFRNLPV